MVLSERERMLLYANTLLRAMAAGRLNVIDVLIGNFDTITLVAVDPKAVTEAID